MFNTSYYTVDKKSGISPFQNTLAYLGGSAIQTVVDNPVTAYRQLVQQYAKNLNGIMVSPSEAIKEANKTKALLKVGDRVRMEDGKAVGSIDNIEKGKATVNYGIFTTIVSLDQLELVQAAKKKK